MAELGHAASQEISEKWNKRIEFHMKENPSNKKSQSSDDPSKMKIETKNKRFYICGPGEGEKIEGVAE